MSRIVRNLAADAADSIFTFRRDIVILILHVSDILWELLISQKGVTKF